MSVLAWGLLIAREHRRYLDFSVVSFFISLVCKNREHRWYLAFSVVLFFSSLVCEKLRTPVRSCDLVALFEPSEGPLEALWGHSWGTVSAYPFNMLKKP